MNVDTWQDEESLRLKVALNLHANAVLFDDIQVSPVMTICYRAMQKARRVLADLARRP